jgi:hypothetical protein
MTALNQIREGLELLRAKSAAEHALLPFPDCPDDRRAAPNDIIRSGLFGVVKRGPRTFLRNQELPATSGWKLYYTGERLDQTDLDIWLEVMHRSRLTVPGSEVRFTLRSILYALGKKDSGTEYKFLKKRLEGMSLGGFSLESEDGKKVRVTGHLFTFFEIDKNTGEGVIETNKRLRALYDGVTFLNFHDRIALTSQLSKWLHALVSSHAQWMPTKVETLLKQSGSSCAETRWFRAKLRTALKDLQERHLIQSWEIDERDLVRIDRDLTPSQQRHIGRIAPRISSHAPPY